MLWFYRDSLVFYTINQGKIKTSRWRSLKQSVLTLLNWWRFPTCKQLTHSCPQSWWRLKVHRHKDKPKTTKLKALKPFSLKCGLIEIFCSFYIHDTPHCSVEPSLSLRSILCGDTQVLKPKTNPIFPYPPPHSDISLSLTFRTQTFGRGASGMMAVLGQKMEFLGENFQFKFWFIFSEIAKLKTIHCYCLSICFFSLKNLKTKIHLKYKSGPQSSIKFWGRIKIVNIFWNSPSQCPTPPSCLLSPRARDFCILRVEITK